MIAEANASSSRPSVSFDFVTRCRSKIDAATGADSQAFLRQCLGTIATEFAGPVAAAWLFDRDVQLRGIDWCGCDRRGDAARHFDNRKHRELVSRAVRKRQAMVIQLKVGEGLRDREERASLLALVELAGGETYVIELLQRWSLGCKSLRRRLALLQKLCCRIAVRLDEYALANVASKAREVDRRRKLSSQIHSAIDLQDAAVILANEGRQRIECDRMTVLRWVHGRAITLAVSGTVGFDRRSNTIRLMEELATVVVRSGEPLYDQGRASELPAQVAMAVQRYIDVSNTMHLSVVPLIPAADNGDGSPVGAVIVESFSASTSNIRRDRLATLAQDAASAFRAIRQREERTWGYRLRSSRIRQGVLLAALIGALALLAIPRAQAIRGSGILRPVVLREVFAPATGVVDQIFVRHGQRVSAGEELIRLKDSRLDLDLASLNGQRLATREEHGAIEHTLHLQGRRLSAAEAESLATRRNDLAHRLQGLEREIAVLNEQKQLLSIVSPIDADVSAFDLDRLLNGRPVQAGQRLLTLYNTTGEWQLDVQVPESEYGKLIRAQLEGQVPLQATCRLATQPDEPFEGVVDSVDSVAIDSESGEKSIRLMVRCAQFDEGQLCHYGAQAVVTISGPREPRAVTWWYAAVRWANHQLMSW